MTRIKLFLFGICYLFMLQFTIAQGIHYTPFYTTPTALNPAFTGMFDGKVRAGALYRNQWSSVTVPYFAIGASADLPVLTMKKGYFAAGIQVMKDQAGDGNLSNFTAAATASYHRSFNTGKWLCEHPLDIGLGLQAEYSQVNIGISHLYFNTANPFSPPTYGVYGWQLGLANTVNSYQVSTGISVSQALNKRFNYTLGVSAHNLTTPNDEIERPRQESLGIDRYYSIVAGANWQPVNRLRISPALLYIRHNTFTQAVSGCEFGCRVSRNNVPPHHTTSVFVAGYYRTGEAVTAVAGIEHRAIKMGLGYDYPLNTMWLSNGSGGIELTLKYTAPHLGLKLPARNVPCSRF